MDNQKWKLANQDESVANEPTVTLLEVKLESNVRGIGSTGDDGNVDTAVAGGAVICGQRRLSEDKLRDINNESGCDKEELMPAKNFTLKKLQEIVHNLESIKDDMLESDLDLWSRQFTEAEKRCSLHITKCTIKKSRSNYS